MVAPTSAAVNLRLALLTRFGPRSYRVRASGDVEVYGSESGSTHERWYRFCHVDEVDACLAALPPQQGRPAWTRRPKKTLPR